MLGARVRIIVDVTHRLVVELSLIYILQIYADQGLAANCLINVYHPY